MKKADVEKGGIYLAKVSGRIVPVRIGRPCSQGGWYAESLLTRREVRIRTAARLRQRYDQPVTELTVREGREYAEQYPVQEAGPMCDVITGCTDGSYRCTRPQGHDGPHVAHGTRGAIATWESAGVATGGHDV